MGDDLVEWAEVFPAPAGMNRPRCRGGGKAQVFPAPAGMNRAQGIVAGVLAGIPRTRGDEPSCKTLSTASKQYSPHPRG